MRCSSLIVLKPLVLSLKNRWVPGPRRKSYLFRDFVAVLLSAFLLFTTYNGSIQFFSELKKHVKISVTPSEELFAGFFLSYFLLVLFSAGVSSLGAFFLGQDIHFYLSSPIRPFQLFFGKFCQIVFSSSWMLLVFGLPVISAASETQILHEFSFGSALFSLTCLSIGASAVGAFVVIIFSSLISASRTREILLASVFIFTIVLLMKISSPVKFTENSYVEAIGMAELLYHSVLLPTLVGGAARIIAGTQIAVSNYILVAGQALLLFLLSWIAFKNLHQRGLAKALSDKGSLRIDSKRGQKTLSMLTPFFSPELRAIVAKEFKLFARDVTQVVQYVLLLSICVAYIFNFRILGAIPASKATPQELWAGLLFFSNLALGYLIMGAVCVRFVFPAISLEGRSIWLLKSAPISERSLIKAKLIGWMLPIGATSSIILSTGAAAVDASFPLVIFAAISTLFVVYGFIAIALSLGSIFANFEWDHSAQLTTSIGSFVAMLVLTIAGAINLLPVALLLVVWGTASLTSIQSFTALLLCGLSLLTLNIVIEKVAVEAGTRALRKAQIP